MRLWSAQIKFCFSGFHQRVTSCVTFGPCICPCLCVGEMGLYIVRSACPWKRKWWHFWENKTFTQTTKLMIRDWKINPLCYNTLKGWTISMHTCSSRNNVMIELKIRVTFWRKLFWPHKFPDEWSMITWKYNCRFVYG